MLHVTSCRISAMWTGSETSESYAQEREVSQHLPCVSISLRGITSATRNSLLLLLLFSHLNLLSLEIYVVTEVDLPATDLIESTSKDASVEETPPSGHIGFLHK